VRSLLDADRAAELLSVPSSWLLLQARRGTVPHVRLGRYVRFRESDIEDLIAAGVTGAVRVGRLYDVPTTKRDRAGATAGPMTPGDKS
jgi:excisionase family DNA binding protein